MRGPEVDQPGTARTVGPRTIIAAACIGNALEWYDIAVYTFFATYVAAAFFPGAASTALYMVLGSLVLTYAIRPVGGIVLGAYADRVGRKPALNLSILLMTLATFVVCVLPGYATIGVAAPVIVLAARLVQGFAAGGEFGSATALMAEHMPERRGLAASWQFASQALTTILGTLVGAVLAAALTQEQMASWGFRVAFAVGLLVGPVGLFIRRYVPEPEVAREALSPDNTPTRTVFTQHWRQLLMAIGIIAVGTCLNYTIAYIPTYATKTLHLPDQVGFLATLVGGVVLLFGTLASGYWSDIVGRVRVMLPGVVAAVLLAYPVFWWVQIAPTVAVLILVAIVMSLLKAWIQGPVPALLVELFPVRTRASGMAIAYNVSVTLFGSLTPLIAQFLSDTTGHAAAPGFWIVAAALISLVSLLALRAGQRRAPA